MIQEQKRLSKQNKELFEFLSHIQFNIANDKSMLEQNIESPTISKFRMFLKSPKEAILNTYAEVDEIVSDILSESIEDLIKSKKTVSKAKFDKDGSSLNFYLILKKDSEENRDIFYDVAYKLIDSGLSDKFHVNFSFVNQDLLECIDGKTIK